MERINRKERESSTAEWESKIKRVRDEDINGFTDKQRTREKDE